MNQNELYHFGVKGMKWGVRRAAKKDAKEYARAKMFYGEGAGTRRKLIKATVEERSKDPEYKKLFDDALSKQDMHKHAKKAKQERVAKDVKNTTAKTARSAVNIITGHPERLGAVAVGVYGAYQLARRTGADKIITNVCKKTMSDITNAAQTKAGRKAAEDLFRRSGLL